MKAEIISGKEEHFILCSLISDTQLNGNPVIHLLLKNRTKHIMDNESVSSYVIHSDLQNILQKKILYQPPMEPFTVYSYTTKYKDNLPITGTYQMKQISTMQVKLLLQLQITKKTKNITVTIPFPNRGIISNIEATPTIGKCFSNSSNTSLIWKLDTKLLNTKNFMGMVALPGFVTFSLPHEFNEEENINDEDRFCIGENYYAEISYTCEEFDLMDWEIEIKCRPSIKQLSVGITKKILITNGFKIWNSLGDTTKI